MANNNVVKDNENEKIVNSESNIFEDEEEVISLSSPSVGCGSSLSLADSQSISSLISDAGLYSLCGICSLTFLQLFNDDWDKSFCKNTMQDMIKHFQLPSQVFNAMTALMDGEGGDINSFVALIKEEQQLKSSCVKIVEELVLFAVKNGSYDSRMRVLIHHVADILRVPITLIELYEESLVEFLSKEVIEETSTEETNKLKLKKERNKKIKRYFMIGLASVGGGAIIGLTGGLAAPFVAAGAGAIIGGAGAAILGSTAGIAVIGSLFGVAGAGLTGYKMKKRVGGIEEFGFEMLTAGRDLHLTIAISGWVSEENPQAFQEPWRSLMNSREQYCVRYESSYLLELGRAMDYLLSFVVSMAAQEALKYTILSGLLAAIAWPAALLTASSVIDNPWGVCLARSSEVGKHLAEILLNRQQGRRPVTLIGFSLGARVIFHCLHELVQNKGCEGIIQDVIFLGAPVPASPAQWKPFAKVVSGTIINGYCSGDWLLKFLYRTSSAQLRIAGLQAINWNNRRMKNVDLSDIVTGHMDYARKMKLVLSSIGIRTNEQLNDVPDVCIRRTHSDMAQIARYLESENSYRAYKSHCMLRRRYSEPNLKFDRLNMKYLGLTRRSSSLESILSRISKSSGVMTMNSPGTNSPDLLSIRTSLSFQRSPEHCSSKT